MSLESEIAQHKKDWRGLWNEMLRLLCASLELDFCLLCCWIVWWSTSTLWHPAQPAEMGHEVMKGFLKFPLASKSNTSWWAAGPSELEIEWDPFFVGDHYAKKICCLGLYDPRCERPGRLSLEEGALSESSPRWAQGLENTHRFSCIGSRWSQECDR